MHTTPSFISKTLVKLQQALTRTSSLEAVTALGRVLQLVDRVETFGELWRGLTYQCWALEGLIWQDMGYLTFHAKCAAS